MFDRKTFMIENRLALIVTGLLHSIVAHARHSGRSVSEAILFWLTVRRLAASLDSLFTAWRAGTLPCPAEAPCVPALPQPTPEPSDSVPPVANRVRALPATEPMHLPTPLGVPSRIAKRRRRRRDSTGKTAAQTHVHYVTI